MVSSNAGGGRDPLGRDLEVTIRIGPDGTGCFTDLTVGLLPVALALAPHHRDLEQRLASAREFMKGRIDDERS